MDSETDFYVYTVSFAGVPKTVKITLRPIGAECDGKESVLQVVKSS